MTEKRPALSVFRSVAWVFVAAVALFFASPFVARVRVTVANVGATPLDNVRVTVSGVSDDLGSLAPREEKSCWVWPRGETGVTLTFVGPGGRAVDSGAIGYLESGYSGAIRFLVDEHGVDDAEWRVRLF